MARRLTAKARPGLALKRKRRVTFTVDSALLRELGERLVGQPYIALVELVKNAYDADAHNCVVSFEADAIVVTDDGHGMSEDEFRNFWMRVGTTNKQRQQVSRRLGRSVTGSKGVGRLAVQFLADELHLATTSNRDTAVELIADVNWTRAVDAGELTKAYAIRSVVERARDYANRSIHGTSIRLTGLKQEWAEGTIRDLAKELWTLQPPFTERKVKRAQKRDRAADFRVIVESPYEDIRAEFEAQTQGALENWDTKIIGRIVAGRKTRIAEIEVEFRDGEIQKETAAMPGCQLDACEFEIRVFTLVGRQFRGISVRDAREYFKRYGGVHVYDGMFRLPYYGIDQDWLGIEADHSHRLTLSRLLPGELQVQRGLSDLPTQWRLFGEVRVDTTAERKCAPASARKRGNFLKIQVTRDRLVDNRPHQDLRKAVRWAIDYYATRVRLRRLREINLARPDEAAVAKLDRVRGMLEHYRGEIPKEAYSAIDRELDDYVTTVGIEARIAQEERILLGPLAAAGMAALAFEHEAARELADLERTARELKRAAAGERASFKEVADKIEAWIARIRGSRRVFAALGNQADREDQRRLKASATLAEAALNTAPLLRGSRVEVVDVPGYLRLPIATIAEWQALFQNVFVNAVNAMLDSPTRRIVCTGGRTGRRSWLRVSDTGAGIDLETAEAMFEPFRRALDISQERRALGLGGFGLGLTIVRMIAESRGARAHFVEPESPFATAFELYWSTSR